MITTPEFFKKAIAVIMSCLLLFSLVACNTDTTNPREQDSPYVVIVDQSGREISVTQPVERIVSVFYISTSLCIALGIAYRLVGIEGRAAERPIYALAMPELLELPVAGTARDFSVENALAMEPDLVIVPMRQRESAVILTDMGIPAIVVNPENIDALVEMIQLIAVATGSEDRAAALINHINSSLGEFELLIAQIENKPIVYIGGNSSYLSTSPNDMFQASLIRLAGGINAFDYPGETRVDISYEQLLAINPDIIIIPPEATYSREDILANHTLQSLNAVMSGRVYQMPYTFEAWDSPIPSFTLGVRWLLTVIHDDLYCTDDFYDAVSAFYYEFYNFEIS